MVEQLAVVKKNVILDLDSVGCMYKINTVHIACSKKSVHSLRDFM